MKRDNIENLMENKILKTIEKYDLINKKDKIVVGVSGGPDSMCLLDFLYSNKERFNIEIYVAHINHMIREEANSETEYVKKYCEERNIPTYIKKCDVILLAKESKVGTEEMGRKIRYDFFEEVAKKTSSNKIAIAHNKNDNVETVLMNLLRGTGISGLTGIDIKRKSLLSNLIYIRPLRETERKEIEKYCEKNKLNPKIDKSNFENIYTRNKVRNILIPYMQKEFNNNLIENINRLSNLAKEEEMYFLNLTKKTYKEILVKEEENIITIKLKEFNNLEKVIKEKIIIYTINKILNNKNGIGNIHIEDIIKLCENNIGNKFLMPNKNLKILIKDGNVNFILQ